MLTHPLRRTTLATTLIALTACSGSPQGPTGDPRAGLLTDANIAALAPTGVTAAARSGDFYMRNGLATFIIQGPNRELSVGPYGGTLVDIALPGGTDHFGELVPVLALGRTIQADSVQVTDPGYEGADAVIEVVGHDERNILYNVLGIAPETVNYNPDGSGLLPFDTESPIGLDIRIIYRLPVNEARLTITYIFTNPSGSSRGVPIAFLLDTRAAVETFAPGRGFAHNISKSLSLDQLNAFAALNAPSQQVLAVHDDIAVSFVPRNVNGRTPPRAITASIAGLGAAILLENDDALGAMTSETFWVRPGQSSEVVLDVIAAPTAGQALVAAWQQLGTALAEVTGCVAYPDGTPVQGVRVGFTHASDGVPGFFTSGSDGCFAGQLPPGDYTALAGRPYEPYSAPTPLTVPGDVAITLPAPGSIALQVDIFNTLDATTAAAHPCRLTLIGERILVEDPALTTARIDDAGGQMPRLWHLRHCNETVDVTPGRYLAYVSRGPEFTRIEQLIDVTSGQTTPITGALRRVVDSAGYAASDFHVHSVYSMDSVTPVAARVLSLAAEGLDFWASTEHDIVADYATHVAAAGLEGELATVPGAEVTTFTTGHFGAYPLDVQSDRVNGGAPDWSARENGLRPLMQEVFDGIHQRGALVQINHPRSGGLAIGAYFSRAGLSYDATTLQPWSDPAKQLVANNFLRFPDGVTYFSDDFDIIEVMNGISTYVTGGMVYDSDVEGAGQDWMNFLSAGRRIVGVANSDTHTIADLPGSPRTMVAGHDLGPAGIMEALGRGNAILTTGPMVHVTVSDGAGNTAGLGDILTPTGNQLTLHLRVETADWYDVDAFDLLANVFLPTIPSGQRAPAFYGPAPLAAIDTPRANGGTGRVATADVVIDLTQPPFDGGDAWLLVRVGGTQSNLFPVLVSGGGVIDPAATTAATFFHSRGGKAPFAMTNPIFLDLDGDSLWHGAP